MSTNLPGIETRNKKKGKNTNTETPEKRSSSRLKTKNEINEPIVQPIDDLTKQPNKKVKTENNSETKISLFTPSQTPKKILTQSLTFLARCAADSDHLYASYTKLLFLTYYIIERLMKSQRTFSPFWNINTDPRRWSSPKICSRGIR